MRVAYLSVFLLCLAGCTAAPLGIPRLREPWTVEGTVVFRDTGKPFASARVIVQRFEPGLPTASFRELVSTLTDSQGRFNIAIGVPGSFALLAKCQNGLPVAYEELGDPNSGQHFHVTLPANSCESLR